MGLLWFQWEGLYYFFRRFVVVLFSLAVNDRLFLLDEAPTGRIFISVKSRDTRWPFHASQFTPWQQHSRLSEKEIEEGKRRVWLEGGDGVRRGMGEGK